MYLFQNLKCTTGYTYNLVALLLCRLSSYTLRGYDTTWSRAEQGTVMSFTINQHSGVQAQCQLQIMNVFVSIHMQLILG